jgi:hypothetical protein
MSCDITIVELVHAYSNPKAGLEILPKLLVKATSTRRPPERPTSRQAQVRLDPYEANAVAAAYRNGETIKGLYLLEGVPVTVCAVATVAWEGSPGVAVFG